MCLPLGQLLQDVHKVDDGEEVAPRVVGDELDLVVVALLGRYRSSTRRIGGEHRVFGSLLAWRWWIDTVVAEFEEAVARASVHRRRGDTVGLTCSLPDRSWS